MRAFLCTRDGRLLRDDDGFDSWSAVPELADREPQCVAVDGSRVLVGTRGNGVFESADGGSSWARIELPAPDVFSVAISAADGAAYAGTEPSRLFVSREEGPWKELEALQEIPSRPRWSFPPRPWTHHVRWIAPDPKRAERLLVGIELGGVMVTDDGGDTFTDHRAGAKLDAHCLAWHPSAESRAYQAAGDGAAWSRDGGVTWEAADGGRDLPYCWALAVDPDEPERWYLSAASGPGAAHRGADAVGKLYRWSGAWQELPLPIDTMPYALASVGGELLAAMADGQILRSRDEGETWDEPEARIGPILAMAVAEG
jgi:photosystem II stability/assembly factor-like uncharacterized protein